MINYQKTCDVCKAIKQNKRLMNEIYNSKFYMKTTGVSLAKVHDRYKHLFSYASLKNHTKKHQFIDESDFTQRHLNLIAKKQETQMLKRTLESKEIWDEVMNIGMEKLQSGEMTIEAKDLLKAAKDKTDYQFKQKDQEMAMIEMIAHFASGENDKLESSKYDRRIIEGATVTNFDPTEESPESAQRREDESRAFYQSLIGDTPPPRTD